ncbi:MAG: translation elongation factor Ts [Candidatus Brocadiaceae bacterium]|nr:translation elongation factor Ts [Candidatus Brocadiaceae bacterium]
MEITAQQVRELREKTGAGMMDCKRALVQAAGDEGKAVQFLREKGLAQAAKKGSRETSEGLIASYVHKGRLGVLLELSCETDFVARNEEFAELANNLAMQVAAMSPLVVAPEDLPQEALEAERAVYRSQFADKPEPVRERIVEGKLEAYYSQVCLLKQEYVRDDSRRVEDIVNDAIAKLGENIKVRRFVRLELGGDSA